MKIEVFNGTKTLNINDELVERYNRLYAGRRTAGTKDAEMLLLTEGIDEEMGLSTKELEEKLEEIMDDESAIAEDLSDPKNIALIFKMFAEYERSKKIMEQKYGLKKTKEMQHLFVPSEKIMEFKWVLEHEGIDAKIITDHRLVENKRVPELAGLTDSERYREIEKYYGKDKVFTPGGHPYPYGVCLSYYEPDSLFAAMAETLTGDGNKEYRRVFNASQIKTKDIPEMTGVPLRNM